MTTYPISFPAPAMDVCEEDLVDVGEAAHAVIREAKQAGVHVFGGGIHEDVGPLMVAADGTVTRESYPGIRKCNGGFCVRTGTRGAPASHGRRRRPAPSCLGECRWRRSGQP